MVKDIFLLYGHVMFRRCAWASQVNLGWLSTEAISTEAIGTKTIGAEAIGTEAIGTAIWKLSWNNYLVCIIGVLVQLSGSYRGATIWCILLVYWDSYMELLCN